MHLSRPRRSAMCQHHEAERREYIIQCHTKSDYVMIEDREMPGPFVRSTGDAGPHDPVT